MKRTLLASSTLALAALVASATPAAADPPHDAVTGGGVHNINVVDGISAHSGPNGEDPRGNVTITIQGDGLFGHGKVTCLLVDGNDAIITWVVTSKNGSSLDAGDVVVTEVVDNGNPGESTTPDLIRNSFEGAIVEDDDNPGCFLPVLAPVPVEQGNYTVRDA
jgi:hypothetical protein